MPKSTRGRGQRPKGRSIWSFSHAFRRRITEQHKVTLERTFNSELKSLQPLRPVDAISNGLELRKRRTLCYKWTF